MLNYFIFQLFRDNETSLSVSFMKYIYATSEAFKRITFDLQKNIAKSDSNKKRKLRKIILVQKFKNE